NLSFVIGGFNLEVQPVFTIKDDCGLMRSTGSAQCRTASGSERMPGSTMKRACVRIQHGVLASASYRSRFCQPVFTINDDCGLMRSTRSAQCRTANGSERVPGATMKKAVVRVH